VKQPVAPDSSFLRLRLRPSTPLFSMLSVVGAFALLAGCAGQLEGNFPPPDGGSSSGTGGSQTGSGGSGTASGGTNGTGGGSGTGGTSGSGGSTAVCDAP